MRNSKSSNNIDPLTILTRLNWDEGDDLELKSAKGGLPQSLWETYSAMANSQGGVILLGMEDNGTVSGIMDVMRLKKSLWDTINNRGKVNINLLSADDVMEIEFSGGKVLAVRVPRAGRFQRPIFLGQNPLTGTYRRNFEGDYHCTEQEVSRMLSDRAEEPADRQILENFTMADLDIPSLQQYRNRFASHKPTHPWLSEDDQTLLNKLGAWGRDRQSGVEGVTVAGLLMFGKEESLREALPQYHVDYREKFSDDPYVRWTDRFTIDGTWAGNLFQFYLRVIQRLATDLKLPFKLDGDLFRKGETVVHEAIREALVNTLIHADYQGMGGVLVEKYQERFEFSNPGTLLVSVYQLFRGNVSECRNKSLQTMFMMIGAGEKAGSGIDKIWNGWKSQHWRYPKLTEHVQPDRVQWTLPMISMIPEESLNRLEDQFRKRFHKFSKLDVQALVTADIEGSVDNVRMRQITGEHSTDITRLLQGLVSKGALVQVGLGRWTQYRLPKIKESVIKDTHSIHKKIDSVHKEADSVHKETGSVHKEAGSVHKEAGSVHKEAGSVHKEADGIKNGDRFTTHWNELLNMAAVARENKRLVPKEMEQLILRLCKDNWLTRRELGDLLERNIDGLRSRFLTSMVEHGLLRLRHPDKPNRVDQAYTTAKDLESVVLEI